MAGEPVRLGMVRLTDAAPLVYAHAHGLFERQGIRVRLEVEPSWANVADKLAWGLLDGAVMLPPLAIGHAARPARQADQPLHPRRHQPQWQRHHPRHTPG